jgi:hypothetical protein
MASARDRNFSALPTEYPPENLFRFNFGCVPDFTTRHAMKTTAICPAAYLLAADANVVQIEAPGLAPLGFMPCASPQSLKSWVEERIGIKSQSAVRPSLKPRAAVFWLQGIPLGWMLIEFGVSLYAAVTVPRHPGRGSMHRVDKTIRSPAAAARRCRAGSAQ